MQKNTMIGRRLGNYKIDKLIDEGGMSTVYEGVHMSLGRRVAIKQLNPLLEQKDIVKDRFKSEAMILCQLKHPGIVSLYDYIECELGVFIIMELIKGKALDEYLKLDAGPIPEPKAIKFFVQMLDAIGYMHSKNIIHRDIKPSNFIVTKDDEIKILDFGIAKNLNIEDPHITKQGTKVGTVLYMSPQQVKGQALDRRTDIYSLGITFFHILTGQLPYDEKLSEYEICNKIINEPLPSLSIFYVGVSSNMEDIIYKACAKKPLDRYQDCQSFKDDILKISKSQENIANNQKTRVFDISSGAEYVNKSKTFWRNAFSIGAVAIFLVAMMISFYSFSRQEQFHVIQNGSKLYKSDSLNSKVLDNLNYGEVLKMSLDIPESKKGDYTWVYAQSIRGIKGYIPKEQLVNQKVFKQINQMFIEGDMLNKTPWQYKLVLWKYFWDNKYFKQNQTLFKVGIDSKDDEEFSGIALGDFNDNGIIDMACVLNNTNNITCKLLIFLDNSQDNIILEYPNQIKIKNIDKGEKGGGYFLGNTYNKYSSNGGQYKVNKYEFLSRDGILLYDVVKQNSTVCLYDNYQNQLHLFEQPK